MARTESGSRWWVILALVLALTSAGAGSLAAQQEADEAEEAEAAVSDEEIQDTIEEVIVVTASRTEQTLLDAPASMTVMTGEMIEMLPADDYGDLLRNVPGLNVSQMSARDIQVTGRSATNSLATSELVLLDGRTLYLDFFGFVMWDFMPVSTREIKQIEVVRGPGSAVWGANAMSGVINVITKTPGEMAGTSVMLGAGELGTLYGSLVHAGVKGKLGYKLSGSYYEQDPYPRPTGVIPGTNTPYPPFQNEGTEQPKIDLRFDWDSDGDAIWSFGGGWAGTDGIIHSGIGPFDIQSGTQLSYAKAEWARRAMRVGVFANLLDGDADNLLTIGLDGRPIPLGFESQTYNLEFSNSNVVAGQHILTYGANLRTNSFDLTIAPQGDDRDETGVFLQDEILFGDKVRWLVGARWDDIDSIDDPVVSPRTTLMIAPAPDHVFRISYNRAFRAPSLINNFLDITIVNPVLLPTGLFIFPSQVVGNIDLDEEQLDAVEFGWVGNFPGRLTVSAALYRNESTDSIDFFTSDFYTAANPPPGWPLPPIFLDFPPLAGALPSEFSYRNVGRVVDQGIELSLNHRPSTRWSWFLNYSLQDDPAVRGIPKDEVNLPPTHRFNLGAGYDTGRFFVSGNVNYQDEAFWTDVLDARFHGPTDSFAMLNLTAGVRLANERATLSIVGSNVFDEDVQQHVFGDILERKLVGQLSFNF